MKPTKSNLYTVQTRKNMDRGWLTVVYFLEEKGDETFRFEKEFSDPFVATRSIETAIKYINTLPQ